MYADTATRHYGYGRDDPWRLEVLPPETLHDAIGCTEDEDVGCLTECGTKVEKGIGTSSTRMESLPATSP
jgi:hypothetical protein